MSSLELKRNIFICCVKKLCEFFLIIIFLPLFLWDPYEFAKDNKFNFGMAFNALNAAEVQGAIELLPCKCLARDSPHLK